MFESYTRSTQIILNEAAERGIKVEEIYEGRAAKLTYSDHSEFVFNQFTSSSTSVAAAMTRNKAITKKLLDDAGITVPKGVIFSEKEFDKAVSLVEKGGTWVLKPSSSSQGDCVFADIKDIADLEFAFNIASQKHKELILEEKVLGKEYRIVATSKKVSAVMNRIPANVTGDGKKTIKELIEEKNHDPRRGTMKDPNKPLFYIAIDDVVLKTLSEQSLDLDSIIGDKETIYLRHNSNLSTGGDSVDHTDQIHPEFKKIAQKAIEAIPGLSYGGIDLITNDISVYSDNYAIIEINVSPGISMHHFPSIGTPRNVAGDIIDDLFPETKKA